MGPKRRSKTYRNKICVDIEYQIRDRQLPRPVYLSQRIAILKEFYQARLVVQQSNYFLFDFWLFEVLCNIYRCVAIWVTNVCTRAMIKENTDRSRILQLIWSFDSQMHGCVSLIVSVRKLIHGEPSKNINHGQLWAREDGPMKRCAAAMIALVDV